MRNRLLIIFLFIGLGLTVLRAQSAQPTSGGDASGDGGTMSYTVGQLVYTSNTASGGTILQGVQQSYEIWIVTENAEGKQITLSVSAYPNPTTDYLIVHIDDTNIKELYYQLIDLNGKILENKMITDNEATIDMHTLARTIYFLKVTKEKTDLKTFKIIKN